MAETVILNARVSPEVKKELTEIIDKIMRDNQYKKAGDAYAELVEIIKQQQNEIVPDFSDQIRMIRANLNAVLSGVLSMNDVFKSFQENQKQQEEQTHKGLMNQINLLNQKNAELEKQHESDKKLIENLTRDRDNFKRQLENYQKQLHQQNQTDQLLKTLTQLLGNAENNDSAPEEKEMIPIPGQMNITDYENE